MTFTATLSAASGQTVTVNYATGDGTASILCEFCGQGYGFDAGEIAALFSREASTQPAAPGLQ